LPNPSAALAAAAATGTSPFSGSTPAQVVIRRKIATSVNYETLVRLSSALSGKAGHSKASRGRGEATMTNHIWHAFYFEGSASTGPPVRTELIEAESEEEAAEVAKSHLGDCKRVDLAPPRWEAPTLRVILAENGESEKPSVH
jgi:hypothetical protein